MRGLFNFRGMELGAIYPLRAKDSAAIIARAKCLEDVPERRQFCLSVRLGADGNARKTGGKARQRPATLGNKKKATILAVVAPSRKPISHPKDWAIHVRLG